MNSRVRLPAVALFVVVSAAGCSQLRQVLADAQEPPRLVLESAKLGDGSLREVTLGLAYRLENPGPFAAEISQIEYALTVGGRAVEVKAPASPGRVVSNGAAKLSFPARIEFARLGELSGPVKYVASGSVTVTGPSGPVRLPFAYEGQLEAPRKPTVAVGVPRLSRLSLTGGTFELPLEVENPNGFALDASFSGALSIAGVQVASIPATALGTLTAKATKATTVPIEFRPGGSTATVATTKGVFAFDGALESGGVTIPVKWSEAVLFPQFKFERVALGPVDFEGATVELVFSADNPTDAEIEVASLDYALLVDGKPAAAVKKSTQATKLAPRSKSEVKLPVEVRFANASSALLALFKRNTASLRTEGSFVVPTPIGPSRGAIAGQDVLALPKLPGVTFGSPRLRSLSITEASFEVPVELVNANTFAVPVGGFSGTISLGGARVGTVALKALGDLAPGEKRKLSLPVTFEVLRFASAANALRTGTGALGFDGSLNAAGLDIPIRWSETVRFAR